MTTYENRLKIVGGNKDFTGDVEISGSIEARGKSDGSTPAAGEIGEIITSQRVRSARIAAASNVAADVASINLTPGVWELTGTVLIVDHTGSSTSTVLEWWISSASATVPAANDRGITSGILVGTTLGNNFEFTSNLPKQIINTTGSPTYYLGAKSTYSGDVRSAGIITARRIR